MDDSRCREFFSQPTQPYHRRYEALRAVFVEGRAQQEVAEQFGFAYGSLRQLLHEFRQHCGNSVDASPFFESRASAGQPCRRRHPRTEPPTKKLPRSRTAGSRSHIDDFNFDQALGLFAGLNVLPKKSFAADYSYRTQRGHQQQLLAGWVKQVSPLLLPEARSFSLDFHPIPYRGEEAVLENHYLPCRGQAGPSVQSFFAQQLGRYGRSP